MTTFCTRCSNPSELMIWHKNPDDCPHLITSGIKVKINGIPHRIVNERTIGGVKRHYRYLHKVPHIDVEEIWK